MKIFKLIDPITQLNPVESLITHCFSYYSVSCHPSLKSVLSILNSYHSISEYRIKSIFPTTLGYNVLQVQTSLTTQHLVKIALFNISYRINSSGNVSGVFGVLTIISHAASWFDIRYNERFLFWNHICILIQQLII